MKHTTDLDFLSLFWKEAMSVEKKIIAELPQTVPNNVQLTKAGSFLHIVNFSDISGQSWGVSQVLIRLGGRSKTLIALAEKINFMIERGRANDVKPMLEKIVTGRVKTLTKKSGKQNAHLKELNKSYHNEYLGKGHFRHNYQAYTLTAIEIDRIKKYFNL
jgi:hypothetical protein